jgi:ribose transport system permease protein
VGTSERPVSRGRAETDAAPSRLRHWILHAISNHGLLLILVLLLVVFSLLKPNTFPTQATLGTILETRSVIVILALGVMMPIATNQFDLSVGFVVALTNSLVVGLQVDSGVAWELAVLASLVVGAAIGTMNGALVAYGKIDSFVTTLGTGTVIYGLANWYTGGQQIVGQLDPAFISLTGFVLGVPQMAFYAIALAILLWIALEYLPFGRYFYAVGANRRASELIGINPERRIVTAFAISGFLAAAGGILLASQLRIGQTNTGPDYLLPVFAAALLGSTSVRPGRVNVWGTVIAVFLVAVALAGLQQLGSPFYVEYIFNGTILIIAVGSAGIVGRRRAAARRAEALRHAAAQLRHGPGERSKAPL